MQTTKCAKPGCGRDAGNLACGACGRDHYCSRECQKQDWREHKHFCAKELPVTQLPAPAIEEILRKTEGYKASGHDEKLVLALNPQKLRKLTHQVAFAEKQLGPDVRTFSTDMVQCVVLHTLSCLHHQLYMRGNPIHLPICIEIADKAVSLLSSCTPKNDVEQEQLYDRITFMYSLLASAHIRNRVQGIHYANLAIDTLKLMKGPVPVERMAQCLSHKQTALHNMGKKTEALVVAKEQYNMLAVARGPAAVGTIDASTDLIESLLSCGEYYDAERFSRINWESIVNPFSDIPLEKRDAYVATGASLLARATAAWAKAGGFQPGAETERAGEEAIALARQSLSIKTHLNGPESPIVALSMNELAEILSTFGETADDDEERLLAMESAMAIHVRMDGSRSMKVAAGTFKLSLLYEERALAARTEGEVEKSIALYFKAGKYAWEGARVFALINDRDMEAIVRGRAEGIDSALEELRDELRVIQEGGPLPPLIPIDDDEDEG